MQNKRGQGLSTNAIILIVLGVVVLAVLIIGFTLGWGKIAPWISADNVDAISTVCEVACSTNSVYDYCNSKRELKDGSETLKDVTCYYLSEKEIKYGINKCGNICSDVSVIKESDESDEKCDEDKDKGKVMQIFKTDTKTLDHTTC